MKTSYQMIRLTITTKTKVLPHNTRPTCSYIDKKILARIGGGELVWTYWNNITFGYSCFLKTLQILENKLIKNPSKPHSLYAVYKK